MKRLTQIMTAVSTSIFASNALAEPLAVGSAVPVVEQKNQDEQVVKLAEVGAKGYLLVYFYPKADTPGCTKQACSLRDSYAALTDQGVKTFGVSSDKAAAQKAFKDKYKLPFDLLADHDAKVIDAFGVPKTMGFSKRQAFLFKDGKLVWSDLSASTEKQAEDVLKFIAGQYSAGRWGRAQGFSTKEKPPRKGEF
jgi:peroxiredoxin Q/BCP